MAPRWSRRSIRACVIGGLLFAGPVFFVALPAPANSESSSCESLQRWARARYERTAPPTLEAIAQFDRAHRKAIFNAISPEARSALWHDQLGRFAERGDLTSAQQAAVGEALQTVTPALYAQDVTTRQQASKRLWSQVGSLFTDREQARVWFDLGYVVPRTAKSQTPGPLWDRFIGPFQANAQAPFCDCSVSYGNVECYGAGSCVGAYCQMWQGCGPIGLDACVGKCTGS
jgi:hypothetical protein